MSLSAEPQRVPRTVMCIPAEKIRPYLHGFTTAHPVLGDLMGSGEFTFEEKKPVETDPRFKQVIPYVVVFDKETKSFLSYRRKTGDARLVGKKSVGFGGHVEIFDLVDDDQPHVSHRTIVVCAMREISEELGIPFENLDSGMFSVLGLINHDANEVGRVHVGVALLFEPTPEMIKLFRFGEEVESTEYIYQETIVFSDYYVSEYEDWSKLLIPFLRMLNLE